MPAAKLALALLALAFAAFHCLFVPRVVPGRYIYIRKVHVLVIVVVLVQVLSLTLFR